MSIQVSAKEQGWRKEIPGPKGSWLLGSMREIQRDRLAFVLNMAQRYGDVVRYRVAYVSLVQVSHPDGIQHILQDNYKNYVKGFDAIPTLDMTLGHGLLTNEGNAWLKQRRLMQPVFHHRHVESFGAVMTEETEKMLEAWDRREGQDRRLDVASEMMKLTLNIVNRTLFSSEVRDRADAVGQAITVLLRDATLRFDLPFYPAPNIPTPHNRAFLRALNDLNKIIYGLIEGRRRNPGDQDDLLSLLIHASDPETGEAMNDKQLRDEVITLFLAGHETTAATLSWAWYLISQHPAVEAKLHAELERVLGGRTPSSADLPALVYTRMLVDETLRLYPPAWVLSRRAIEDDEIRGYAIPAGSMVSISPYVMHHHPAYWEQPERFEPERFAPGVGDARRPRYAYFPFGGGPRQCIGKGFAQVEAQLLLAMIAQRWRLRMAPGERAETQPLVTLRPRNGLKMVAVKR